MEFVEFDMVFDLSNQTSWRVVNNLSKLKAEIVRAYGYIDTLTPDISNLRTEINELRQQLAQPVPYQPDDSSVQELGNTGIKYFPGHKTNF
jgi:capsule polysaccharide export protein KpsE/RkpR